jgi:hypothetical protein
MNIRDRIAELRRVPASLLVANPKNWRVHPEEQCEAVRAILEQVGMAAAVLGRVDSSGDIVLIDGHLRASLLGDDDIPVLVLDVTEDEADKLLLTLDPLKEMADLDRQRIDTLLTQHEDADGPLASLMQDLARKAGLADEMLEPEESSAKEIDTDGFDFSHVCTKCGFEFND